MTLTRILPTLRRTIPDPIARDRWPKGTHATISDVEVGGVSLVRLADLCGTPAVHIAPASVPGSNGTVASPTMHTGVVVVRVVEASEDPGGCGAHAHDRRRPRRRSTRCGPRRASSAAPRSLVPSARNSPLRAGEPADAAPADLPADIASGDLIALPYAAVTDDAGLARPLSGWRASAATTSPADDVAGR